MGPHATGAAAVYVSYSLGDAGALATSISVPMYVSVVCVCMFQ